MSDFLKQHAIKNIWCSPGQDRQAIVSLPRYGKVRGVYEDITLPYETIVTPTKENYIVYHIGHYPPSLFGLDEVTVQWKSLDVLATNNRCVINLYTNYGRLLPLHDCYIRKGKNGKVMLAMLENKNFDLLNRDVFFHHYKNAHWQSDRFDDDTSDFWVAGITRTDTNEDAMMHLYNRWNEALILNRQPQFYHNGRLTEIVEPGLIKVGDSMEIRVDQSITNTVAFDVDSLEYNFSELDRVRKYILDLGPQPSIVYHDDVEFRVCRMEDGKVKSGFLFHRNKPENVRMIAEAAYTLSVDQVEFLRQQMGSGNCYILITFRKSGYHRELIYENSRLHELNQFSVEERRGILTGKINPLDLWDMNALEQSSYPKLMRAKHIDDSFTIDLAKCYGYNAMTYYAGFNQSTDLVKDGLKRVSPPPLYVNGSCHEYADDGTFLGITNFNSGQDVFLKDDTTMVEFMQPKFHDVNKDALNATSVPNTKCRIYSRKVGTQDWTDITNGTVFTRQPDGTYTHDFNDEAYEWVIRHDDDGWYQEYDVNVVNGKLGFVLLHGDEDTTMELPYGDIIVRLNDKELIQDIDYTVERQVVMIAGKKWIKPDEVNKVSITCWGYPPVQTTGYVDWGKPAHIGWVDHGLVTLDDDYDLTRSILYRPVVDNVFINRSEVQTHEDSDGSEGTMRNGAPFALMRMTPGLEPLGYETVTSLQLRNEARSRDRAVSDYMTLHKPLPKFSNPSPIPERHQVYSVFMATIVDDLLSGVLETPSARLTDSQVRLKLSPYNHLLGLDVVYKTLDTYVNDGLTSGRPHLLNTKIEVPAPVLNFIKRVSQLYFNDKIDMGGHFTIAI